MFPTLLRLYTPTFMLLSFQHRCCQVSTQLLCDHFNCPPPLYTPVWSSLPCSAPAHLVFDVSHYQLEGTFVWSFSLSVFHSSLQYDVLAARYFFDFLFVRCLTRWSFILVAILFMCVLVFLIQYVCLCVFIIAFSRTTVRRCGLRCRPVKWRLLAAWQSVVFCIDCLSCVVIITVSVRTCKRTTSEGR